MNVMKKIISISLVFVLIFALAVSTAVSAASPTPKTYYSISVDTQGSGSASANPVKVQVNSDGTTTLTATEKDGFFTKWIISGDYEIVSGSLETSTLVIKPSSDISAIASFRAEEDNLVITIKVDGDGDVKADPKKVAYGSNDTVTLTFSKTGADFIKWNLTGDYEIVSGSLNSEVLVIRPFTDITAVAQTKASSGGGSDKSETSPKTGYPLYAAIALMALALGTAAVAMKKVKD